MRRHSRAGAKPVKTRRRETAEQKRRNAPKIARRRGSPADGLSKKVALFKRERDEALEDRNAAIGASIFRPKRASSHSGTIPWCRHRRHCTAIALPGFMTKVSMRATAACTIQLSAPVECRAQPRPAGNQLLKCWYSVVETIETRVDTISRSSRLPKYARESHFLDIPRATDGTPDLQGNLCANQIAFFWSSVHDKP
jgi:hypothetical protein